jgi:hypothetical protein
MEASRTLDIDTFVMTAGNIVLSDHGLVSFYETPNATGVCILVSIAHSTGPRYSPLISSYLIRLASSQMRLRLRSPRTFCESCRLHLTSF